MKPIFIHIIIILEQLLKKLILRHLIYNLLQFQNGVKIGFGKDIIKKQNMLQMELILIYINHIKEI